MADGAPRKRPGRKKNAGKKDAAQKKATAPKKSDDGSLFHLYYENDDNSLEFVDSYTAKTNKAAVAAFTAENDPDRTIVAIPDRNMTRFGVNVRTERKVDLEVL